MGGPRIGWFRATIARLGAWFIYALVWLFDEKWFFDTDLVGDGKGMTESLPDRCP